MDCIDKAQGNSTSEKPCQTKLLLVNNCQKPKNEKENGIFFWVRILSIFNTYRKKIYSDVCSKDSKKKNHFILHWWYLSMCQIQNHYFNLLIFWLCEYVILVCHMCTVHASLFLFLVN